MSASKRSVFQIVTTTGVALALYVIGGFVTFDVTKPAYAYDDEIHNGKEVALGPRPRAWLCKPTHHGVAYGGREWPFRFYMPFCEFWRTLSGYEAPVEQRRD